MSDQADTLRKLMLNRMNPSIPVDRFQPMTPTTEMMPTILFVGETRGVGKSFLIRQLNQHYSKQRETIQFQLKEFRLDRTGKPEQWHGRGILGAIVVITPDAQSLFEIRKTMRFLKETLNVNQAAVIVNRVTDAEEGRKLYLKFRDNVGILTGVDVIYLGHFPLDEKPKFLLNLESRPSSSSCLQLLARRLTEFCLFKIRIGEVKA